MLVAAMNPCPCGYFGDLKRECRCSPSQVQRYRQRISGPLLDRIDLHIEVPSIGYRDMASERAEEPSSAIRERVESLLRECEGCVSWDDVIEQLAPHMRHMFE
jgi:magnesium chelatase family protein